MDELNERWNDSIRRLQMAHEQMESDQQLRGWVKWREDAGLSATLNDWLEHYEHCKRFSDSDLVSGPKQID